MQRRIRLKQKTRPEVRFRNKRRAAEEEEEEEEEETPTTAAAEEETKKKPRAEKKKKRPEAAAAAADDDEEEEEQQQFEDPFEDEVEPAPADPPTTTTAAAEEEEEEEVSHMAEDEDEEDDEDEDESRMDMSAMGDALPSGTAATTEVWDPERRPLEDGEELVCDPRAYEMLHRMTPEWPCLSFDVLHDGLGVQRTRFPHTAYVVAGTQAAQANKNKLTIMKISGMYRTRHQRADDDSGSDSEGADDSDDDVEDDPILETRDIRHDGAVNRIRAMPQRPGVIASWSDTGKVHMWALQPWLSALDTPPAGRLPANPRPLQSLNHKEEGFALDWSPLQAAEGCLLTGDGSGSIYLWRPTGGELMQAWAPDGPYLGHMGSVEDLQWSPNEPAVFASCSSDRTIRVWDARTKATALRVCKAHAADVNVISWNRQRPFLMASGSDDGSFRVWDLRSFHEGTPVSDFHWHRKAITSVEWAPDDESVLAVASADNSISVWDFSLEDDPEAASASTTAASAASSSEEPPPQLVFVHMGQLDIKELHWHAQIPKMLISTAADGFNFFKATNL